MSIFEIVYWVGILVEMAIRAPLRKTWKNTVKTEQRVSQTEKNLLVLLWVAMIIIPLLYSATDWLAFANYSLHAWAGWLGVFLLTCALIIFTAPTWT